MSLFRFTDPHAPFNKQYINKRGIKINTWEPRDAQFLSFFKFRNLDLRENLNLNAIAALHPVSGNTIWSYPHVTPSLGDMLLQIALFLKVTYNAARDSF